MPIHPFWRKEPLSQQESDLVELCLEAHRASVFRQNISSVTVLNCAAGSGDYTKCIAGALMTLGGQHAPIEQTMRLLMAESPSYDAELMFLNGHRVPGWGSSFVKKQEDPLWLDVKKALEKDFTPETAAIKGITSMLHKAGKLIYPNPSCYTAATAIAIGLPVELSQYLLVAGRLGGWTELLWRGTHG